MVKTPGRPALGNPRESIFLGEFLVEQAGTLFTRVRARVGQDDGRETQHTGLSRSRSGLALAAGVSGGLASAGLSVCVSGSAGMRLACA